MAKRILTRRQSWRIDKIQQERIARAEKREARMLDELQGGELGHEQEGLVIAHFGVQVEIEALEGDLQGEHYRCYIRANLPALVTGDRVIWRPARQGAGVIIAQRPRRSELCRPDMRGQLKPVAANVDQIVIVFAPLPEPHANLIDRYLVAASHAGIRPLLLLNKADLLDGEHGGKARELLAVYKTLGYAILDVSAEQGDRLETLQDLLRDKTSVFVGQSGVGKSSLVNRLLPDAQMAVGALSELTHKGTHTTTTARLFHFPCGGSLIDSPGIREFGLAHVDAADVEAGFIEFADFLGRCRFRDCSHEHEPGCALLAAVDSGHISSPRLESFRMLLKNIE
ncbi:small ribosomal subunit biogenesis GTPase RsgA [Thiopseudomonas denitrificans]|uniref:Small ribosomal subunit biogenesis GTPase RsgA n=1 Tax=Thiopseudomonas denitrificans TaxID=1501432 RepID=A0A4R6TT77_9GAMM|nr:small ribosomal subunit biogenesis GTPase RsgA [Thiopseudomonas denitrificans]TDQ36858.1 ribosome biogenesis GTPase [Thiopseudomonas denitrificans]